MKRTLTKWLSALLAACLLLTAPVALMEEAIEAAPEEIVFDLGEAPEAEADLEAEVSDDIEASTEEVEPMDVQDAAPSVQRIILYHRAVEYHEIGEKFEPDYEIEPDDAEFDIQISTSNKTVAYYTGSYIEVIGPGVATITIRDRFTKKNASFQIKVTTEGGDEPDGIDIESTFPDEVFRDFVSLQFDLNEDGALSESEIARAKKVNINGRDASNIASLKGLEVFTAMEIFGMGDNESIASIDFSPFKNLMSVSLHHLTALTALDVSASTSMWELIIEDCPLTSVKLGSQPVLEYFQIENEKSKFTLDISGCPLLLDVAKNVEKPEADGEGWIDWSNSSGYMGFYDEHVTITGYEEKPVAPTDITITGPASVKLSEKTAQFTSALVPSNAAGTIKWSVSSSGASIDQTGKVSFTKAGTFTVTAAIDKIKKTATLTVLDDSVPESITVTAPDYKPNADGSYTVDLAKPTVTLKAVCEPTGVADQHVTWTVSPSSFASVKDGVVTLKKQGQVTVVAASAKSKAVTGEVVLNIEDHSIPSAIDITAEGYAKNADGSYTVDVAKPTVKLTAVCTPDTAIKTVTWKVTPSGYATVKDGVVTLKKQGSVTVVATSTKDKTVTGEVELNIEDHSIPKDIEVTAPGYTKNAEGHYVVDVAKPSVSLKAVCTPDEAVKTVTWKVVPTSFASISKDGVLTLKKQGQVTVIATSTKDKTVTGEAVLDIEDHSVPNKLSIDAVPEDTLNKSLGKYTLSVTVEPAEAVKTVTWKSSASSVASVDKNGVLTLKKQGYVTLTATSTKDKTVSDIITLFVKDDTIPEQIDVTAPDYAKNAEGQYVVDVAKPTVNLKAIVQPASAIQTVNWKVAPSGYATVKNGVLTLKKKGVVTVTATSTKDKAVFGSAEFNILDNSIPDKLIFADVPAQLNKSQGTYKLTFTTEPAIADKNVTWKSSASSIASINKDGVITLKKQGTVTFTATPKKNKAAAASVTIFVKDNTIPTSLTITPAGPTTLKNGETLQLSVKADTPEADATVTWKSSNTGIVKVNSSTGLVTADKKKTGTATITATSKKDKTVIQTITITVQ